MNVYNLISLFFMHFICFFDFDLFKLTTSHEIMRIAEDDALSQNQDLSDYATSFLKLFEQNEEEIDN